MRETLIHGPSQTQASPYVAFMLIPFVYRITTFVNGTNSSYYSVCRMSDGGCGCNGQGGGSNCRKEPCSVVEF